MCGRFTISKTEQELEKRFGARFYSRVLEARYNVAPTQNCPVITDRHPDEIRLYRWGLVPIWAKDVRIGSRFINGRSETLTKKPAFKDAFQRRRCLVLADGYYEWKTIGGRKVPHRIQVEGGEAFAMAGLWERWNPAPKGESWDAERTVHSFTIITVPAAARVEGIHDRMPAILPREQERLWLDGELPEEESRRLLLPYADEALSYYTVSTAVNKVDNEDPSLLEPVDYGEEEEEPPRQPDLFSGS